MSLRTTQSGDQIVSKGLTVNQMMLMQAKHGDAFTAILHSRPVACFGAVHIWNGVEEIWLYMEERGREYKKTLTRAAMNYIDFRVISQNLHRVQITVRCADMRAVRWGTVLGFTIDGMMKSYGPDGSDYYLMSRT
jgi:hypothetical protein